MNSSKRAVSPKPAAVRAVPTALCFLILAIGGRGAWAGDRAAVRLTHDGRMKFSPIAIGLKGEIIYCELADPTLYRLTRLTLADGSTRPLHPDAQTSEFEPALSADGKGVAYLKTVAPLRVNLVITDDTGSKL